MKLQIDRKMSVVYLAKIYGNPICKYGLLSKFYRVIL